MQQSHISPLRIFTLVRTERKTRPGPHMNPTILLLCAIGYGKRLAIVRLFDPLSHPFSLSFPLFSFLQ